MHSFAKGVFQMVALVVLSTVAYFGILLYNYDCC